MRPSLRPLLTLAAVSFVAVTASLAGTAKADDTPGYREQRVGSDTVVSFPDDPLDGKGLGTLGLDIRIGPKAMRMKLLRPRLNFLSEMYKSVEHM